MTVDPHVLARVERINREAAESRARLGIDAPEHQHPTLCEGCGCRLFAGNTSGRCADCYVDTDDPTCSCYRYPDVIDPRCAVHGDDVDGAPLTYSYDGGGRTVDDQHSIDAGRPGR